MSAPLGGGMAFLAVFGTGCLASLSPCVYPLIPITLGFFGTQARERRKANVLCYASGQVLTFVGLGAFAVFAGESLGFSSESPGVCLATGAVLLTAGGLSLYGRLPSFSFLRRASPVSRFRAESALGGLAGAFVLGAGSALVASPCTSPILASVLALMASQGTLLRGLVLMFCYSLGFSSLFVLLGLGVVNLNRLPRSGRWLVYLHKASAFALLAVGAFFVKKAFWA